MRHEGTAERLIIPADTVVLDGVLETPPGARGVVIFAHGSGSGMRSPRNAKVADALRRCGFATLRFDLLDAREAADARWSFNISLLARRIEIATNALTRCTAAGDLPIGYFGGNTGAAAALVASVDDARVVAIVCRGGRPDLADGILGRVTAPTLFVVGGEDPIVTQLNTVALDRMRCERELATVTGAGHLFEEPGTLDVVGELACGWFRRHVGVHRLEPGQCS